MGEEVNIGLQLKLITDRIRQTGDKAFAEYGLTAPQANYLLYIMNSGGIISQNDLEKYIGVSHPTVTGIVARLREKGFVEIEADKIDRRKRIIRLTAKARSVTGNLAEGSRRLDESMLRGMSEKDKTELGRLLKMIEMNLYGSSEDREKIIDLHENRLCQKGVSDNGR